MYFVKNFYSNAAWTQWHGEMIRGAAHRGLERQAHGTSKLGHPDGFESHAAWKAAVTFEPVQTFASLLERVAFLQLMNKRHVLYFRGMSARYEDQLLPSMLRGTEKAPERITRAFDVLESQTPAWTVLLSRNHPRPRTIELYPHTVWAVQQHYKDLLNQVLNPKREANGFWAGESPYLDLSHSPRIAAIFALDQARRYEESRACVHVVALPQTTGSITFDTDQQLQIMRLSALCPPEALRPQLQEAYLVGRFPFDRSSVISAAKGDSLAELYSLRRRIVAMIPIEISDAFWGPHGQIEASSILSCPWFRALKPSSTPSGSLSFS
jgi:hypothetical protein